MGNCWSQRNTIYNLKMRDTDFTPCDVSWIFWECVTEQLLRITDKYLLVPITGGSELSKLHNVPSDSLDWHHRVVSYPQCTEPRPAQGELIRRWPWLLTCPPQQKGKRRVNSPCGINRISNLQFQDCEILKFPFICSVLSGLHDYICVFDFMPFKKHRPDGTSY